ncbi:hypothetical protein QFC21_004601 [Naganishia friedmannii]|uniref:Uncharacterized protein n=1 Tax=Naganishia friedmannii TaxID=89922 RepID=A0ACC2VG43_9TREE|nr:hypothetical protein QFC21_004601 [Naganishia friedmannii]
MAEPVFTECASETMPFPQPSCGLYDTHRRLYRVSSASLTLLSEPLRDRLKMEEHVARAQDQANGSDGPITGPCPALTAVVRAFAFRAGHTVTEKTLVFAKRKREKQDRTKRCQVQASGSVDAPAVEAAKLSPHYGYFAKQATIFSTRPSSTSSSTVVSSPAASAATDITSHPNLTSFQEAIAEAYEREYGAQVYPAGTGEGAGDDVAVGGSGKGGKGGLGRQVWHTPTELFRPYYSRIIARALLSHYKLHHYPHTDLRIYEIGAGNGSLMVDVLSFLRDEHPEVFERTRYEVVEISAALAERQKQQAEQAGFTVDLVRPGQKRSSSASKSTSDRAQVRISNVDFLDWSGSSKESCYFVALEVFDNFAHDMIRYNLETLEPMQAVVTIDATGDFSLLYEPVTDPVIRRYLGYRRLVSGGNNSTQATGPLSSSHLPVLATPPINPLLLSSPLLRKIYTSLPFAPNLSAPEFIPTKQILFLEKLREALPFHRLLVSDFDSLPDAVVGRNGPVVQTRYGGEMVPCETFLVKQGYFDIFFPTGKLRALWHHFGMLKEMYSLIMTSPPRKLSSNFFSPHRLPESSKASVAPPDLIGVRGFKHRHVGVYDHADFLTRFGSQDELKGTTTKDGDNVMLSMYKNVKFVF